MKAIELHKVLTEHSKVDLEQLNVLYEQLPSKATVAQYRELLVKSGLLRYGEIMTLFISKGLAPRSRTLLEKLSNERKSSTTFKPTAHQQKFHLGDAELVPEIAVAEGHLPINIPPPTEDRLTFHHSDEKQAILLALEMAVQGDPGEAEVILLETIDSFENSEAAMQCLCWLYLATGHAELIHRWASRNLANHQEDTLTLELLSLAEQILGKHLLATSHYQQLLRKDRVKSSWYVLLAASQEASHCFQEAIENYRIYLAVGKDPKLQAYAKSHLHELSRK
jgi:tetratricopeptide (TPR) repeat protein